jgi:hypothetical protein
MTIGPPRLSIWLLALTAIHTTAMMLYGQTAQLIPENVEAAYRATTPKTDDDEVNAIVQDPRTIFYDRKAIPLMYWQNGTFRDGLVDIGPSNRPRPHNGARAFPWNSPGGTGNHDAGGDDRGTVSTFKFLWLPKGEAIAWDTVRRFEYNTLRGQATPDGYLTGQKYPIWVFPSGTVFGEVLGMRFADGNIYPFELRIRRKEWDEWGVDFFRPFPASEDLLRVLPPHDPVHRHLQSRRKLVNVSLRDNYPHAVAVDKRADFDPLPSFGPSVSVPQLLRRRFGSALGVEWASGAEGYVVGASNSGQHIAPPGYAAGLMGGDRVGCADCHESTAVDISKFFVGRDWYGYIRGSDRILSFHICDPTSISSNRGDRPWRLNPAMAGILERYNPSVHLIHHNTTKRK